MQAAATATAVVDRSAEIARGLAVKRKNAIAAIVTGASLALLATHFGAPGSLALALAIVPLGFLCGIVYANAFEYALHRWFLHRGNGFLLRSHALHHDSVGLPEEPRYVNFASSLWVVVLLFVSNAPPVFAFLWVAGRWAPAFSWGLLGAGIFAGFTLYYVLYEEIHWRMHIGGWLPSWLDFSRRHHMRHHGDFPGCYNVFLPLFDWVIGLLEKPGAARVPR